jgi:hypothetical protein
MRQPASSLIVKLIALLCAAGSSTLIASAYLMYSFGADHWLPILGGIGWALGAVAAGLAGYLIARQDGLDTTERIGWAGGGVLAAGASIFPVFAFSGEAANAVTCAADANGWCCTASFPFRSIGSGSPSFWSRSRSILLSSGRCA